MTTTQSEKDRVVIFDTTLARRRAMPRRDHDARGEDRSRRTARHHGRRHHRGGLPDRLGRRLRRRQRDRQAHQECRGVRPLARRLQRHRPLRRGDQAGRAQAHPHLPLHLAGAHEVEAPEGAARGARHGDRAGDARAQSCRRRRVERRGRHAHRVRVPLPLRRGRHQGRRDHDQYPGHRRLHDAGGIFRDVHEGPRGGAELRQGDVLGALPQRSRHGGREFARRREGGRAADRMHHQRHRRARRQHRARRSRDGDEGAQRRAAVLDRASTPRC